MFSSKSDKIVYGKNKSADHPLVISEIIDNKKEKSTDLYLSSARQPIDTITLYVQSTNFKRKVTVEGTNTPDKDTSRIKIASERIFNITAGQFHNEDLKIKLQRTFRYLEYRIRIFNEDSPPIDVSSAQGRGIIHEILFFYGGKNKLTVCYGGENILAPRYDVSSVLSEAPPPIQGFRWSLGKEEAIRPKPSGLFVSPKTLLIIALILMVAVLVYVLTVIVKKVDAST